MKNPRILLTVAMAGLLALVLIGCSDDSSPVASSQTGTDDYAAIDFDLPYGGLTKSDEEPSFGDPYLEQAEAEAAEDEFEDEYADDPEVQRLIAMGQEPGDPDDPERPRFTYLRILWGDLDGPVDEAGRADDGEAVDWSGLLRVDRGHVLVRRVISFERPGDSIVRPRPDRHTVAWFSHTGGHYDGLLIQIVEPPHNGNGDGDGDGGAVPEEPNVLHFETMAFSQDFVIDDLAGLDELYDVEPAGNAIHFTGFTLSDLDDCPKGFLSGIWRDDPENDEIGGTFRGRWVSVLGASRGSIQGAYGLNEDGERVFFGKYIARDGTFLGLLAGTWQPREEIGHGEFQGHWINNDDTVEGVLGGRWLDLPVRQGGFFQGRWAADCDEEAVEEIGT